MLRLPRERNIARSMSTFCDFRKTVRYVSNRPDWRWRLRLLLLFIAIVFAKALFFFTFASNPTNLFAGGSDADVYDAYALGEDALTSSVWPIWLRFLNEIGLYTRFGVSSLLMLLGVIFIPLLTGRLALVDGYYRRTSVMLGVAVAVSFYPTLFYFTLDIYRDVFMLFLYLSALLFVKGSIQTQSGIVRFFCVVAVFCYAYLLYLFRGYLGFAFIVSYLGFFFFSFRKFSVIFHVVPLLIALNILYALGYFDSLMSYRVGFDGVEGGSSFGIRFDSIFMFVPDFILNVIYQIFGFYFPGFAAILAFLLESVPFVFAVYYIFINRMYSNSFVDFLIFFSVVYSIIWLLGNDNLGTAMRLRLYIYVSFIICSLIVYQRKVISQRSGAA